VEVEADNTPFAVFLDNNPAADNSVAAVRIAGAVAHTVVAEAEDNTLADAGVDWAPKARPKGLLQ